MGSMISTITSRHTCIYMRHRHGEVGMVVKGVGGGVGVEGEGGDGVWGQDLILRILVPEKEGEVGVEDDGRATVMVAVAMALRRPVKRLTTMTRRVITMTTVTMITRGEETAAGSGGEGGVLVDPGMGGWVTVAKRASEGGGTGGGTGREWPRPPLCVLGA